MNDDPRRVAIRLAHRRACRAANAAYETAMAPARAQLAEAERGVRFARVAGRPVSEAVRQARARLLADRAAAIAAQRAALVEAARAQTAALIGVLPGLAAREMRS